MNNVLTRISVLFLVCMQCLLSEGQRKPAAEISHTCDVQQGFYFEPAVQSKVGHLVSLKIGTTIIPADFTVEIPDNIPATRAVVGVMSDMLWPGGITDIINFNTQVSTANKQRITTLLHSAMTNTNVEFKYAVYDYDPMDQIFFPCFSSNEVILYGMIEKNGEDLNIAMANSQSVEVPSPPNYTLTISIVPQNISQIIRVAISSVTEILKQWGVTTVPVELISFTAAAVNSSAVLRWTTATEVNNYGFEVQRSVISNQSSESDNRVLNADSRAWCNAGFVTGNGSSNVEHEYTFVDRGISAGRYSYRLKQIDRDGNFTYSSAIEVSIAAAPAVFGLEQNYPNPFNPTTALSYQLSANSMTTLIVYDALGREVAALVNEVKEAGTYSVLFNASHLATGMYVVRLTSGGCTQAKRMMFIK
jgi:hypothetical protein